METAKGDLANARVQSASSREYTHVTRAADATHSAEDILQLICCRPAEQKKRRAGALAAEPKEVNEAVAEVTVGRTGARA